MFTFAVTALVIVVSVFLVTRKYGTILNPLGFYAGFYFMAAVFAPAIYSDLDLLGGISTKAVTYASILSSVYLGSIAFAFLCRPSPFLRLFRRLFDFCFPLNLVRCGSRWSDIGLLLQFLGLFVALMVASGVGTMWITNSRDAYQYHRASVGVLWSLCQATLLFAFICVLFRVARNVRSVFVISIPFAMVALLLGSKAYTLAYFVLAMFYVHFHVRPLSNKIVIFGGACVLILGLAFQLLQGTASSLISTLLYFDYFNNSAAFIDRFREFGHRYGGVTLSEIWYYVPRVLYPGKPYSYGAMSATELLYPGAAQDAGFTPGLMQWIVGFADWGLIGVVIAGLFTGFFSKGAYEFFLERRDAPSMALFAQVGFIYYIEVFPNAPFPIFFVWLILELLIIQAISMAGVTGLEPWRRSTSVEGSQ